MIYRNRITLVIKALYIVLGSISLGFGVIGIVVPGLPTTPFLLLTAALYVRSSGRLYGLLMNHKVLGPFITNYSGGMNKQMKISVIVIMWIMITVSAFLFIENVMVRIILITAGVTGTFIVSLLPSGRVKPREKISIQNKNCNNLN